MNGAVAAQFAIHLLSGVFATNSESIQRHNKSENFQASYFSAPERASDFKRAISSIHCLSLSSGSNP